MRDMHYKSCCYRLAEEIKGNLKKERPKDLSWNMFFNELLKLWVKEKKNKNNNH
jgi:hypothetical protein